ncbi:hypothetical protein ASPFODRAFT_38679 [Aspergillus luchuensis CBS 106.47]|uniref:Uncharacterized protein n=1 Tax=Aspergillus luchuensis (strain CBS 106.47) TaxID=1137211 RepID=A0A1M3TY74_ASPLC|nr:hypothetical protein ASPFODRAFT_38679 [Aspergillus luchuensis CBS 106.47]
MNLSDTFAIAVSQSRVQMILSLAWCNSMETGRGDTRVDHCLLPGPVILPCSVKC